VLRDHSGFKNKALTRYVDVTEVDSQYPESLDLAGAGASAPLVPGQNVDIVRLRDKKAVLLDGKEVLDTLGVPNKRQTHDLCVTSAYAGYGVGGEPLFTASMPSEKNKKGTECLDYIFFSSGTLLLEQLLSMPLLSEIRRGERSQVPSAREDVPYMKPFQIAQGSFNAPIQKLNQQIGESAVDAELLGGGVKLTKEVNRSAVIDAKRILRNALEKSRVAGNTPVTSTAGAGRGGPRGSDAPSDMDAKTSASGLWGGKWSAFPTQHHQRTNFWLPSETFASSHIALGAEFSIDDALLCTHWS
jgi:hypothetical protein